MKLTKTELRVLATAAEGATNKEVGERLGISARTVQTHLTNMFHKLGVNSRLQALHKLGWVVVPDEPAAD